MKNPIEEAEKKVEAAEKAFQAEKKRLEEANAAVAELTEKIKQTDPDGDPAKFAKLIMERENAKGRIEALSVRLVSAEANVTAAKAALAETACRTHKAMIEDKEKELGDWWRRFAKDGRAFRDHARQTVGEFNRLASEIDDLHRKVLAAEGRPFDGGLEYSIARACPLAFVSPQQNVLQILSQYLDEER